MFKKIKTWFASWFHSEPVKEVVDNPNDPSHPDVVFTLADADVSDTPDIPG